MAQHFVNEASRICDHPGIVFKDGPSGRRAALAFGPDIWELVQVLRDMDEHGEAAVDATAEFMNLERSKVLAAMDYYDKYADEIDTEIAENDAVSIAAEAAWLAKQLPR